MILCVAMVLYELIFLLFFNQKYRIVNKYNMLNFELKKSILNNKARTFVELLVAIIFLIRFITVITLYLQGGLSAITNNNYASLDTNPILSRMVILLYPSGWFISSYWFFHVGKKRRQKFDFLLSLFVVFVLFLSSVKGHVLIYCVGLFIVAISAKKRNIVIGTALLVVSIFVMFFANYALRWFSIDSSVPSIDYTINHFWKYIAGGTINMNGTAFSGTTSYSFFDFWLNILLTIPNMFLSYLGEEILKFGSIPFLQVGSQMALVSPKYSEYSNVVNIFGFFYGNGGINIIGFVANTFVYAYICERSFFEIKTARYISSFVVWIPVFVYAFLSFFSLYYVTTTFWQIIFYSLLFSKLIKRHVCREAYLPVSQHRKKVAL